MKIGLVSPYDWSYPGGVQDHITHLAAELRARGHTVRILTPATGARARQVEYGVYRLGWAAPVRMNGSIARVAIAPDLKGRIRALLEREQFDVLHLHEPFASALSLTMLHLNIPGLVYIGTFHAYAPRSYTSASEWAYVSAKAFLGRYFRRLSGRIAVSQPARDYVSRFFPGNYRIIPNGVDIGRFSPDIAPLPEYDDDKLNVLYLGRFEQRKGAKYLLRAIPTIRQHYPNTRFIFAGDGPLRPAFQELVAKAGWRDVHFPGRIAAEKLPALYASADIFCAPNTGGESQGIVVLEALASGRPVVASDIAGFRTMIRTQREGMLVPPRKHEKLAWAICHLLGDEAARRDMAVAARERATEYSWARVGEQVEAYYQEIMALHAPLAQRTYILPGATPLAVPE
ncbi:MAG: Phosphatidylinositol alpha-mannosyltransferase [Ktedonobacterales bacterium]|nr:MAG: Phosphatidylinositol alpha-mannosyltransferase [Ktedonobacterales bacterium]